MLSELALVASLVLSPSQCATCGPGGGMEFSPGMTAGSWAAGAGAGGGNPYDSVSQGGGGGGDQLYPFDSPEPWLHGWFQEIPAYGGYHTFRPHNYKHVIAQMEVAGRWGMSPTMPYSHQYYHAYRQRAGMHPDFGSIQASYSPSSKEEGQYPGPLMAAAQQPQQPQAELQQVAAIQRGYTGPAIPGISTPYYQVPAPGAQMVQQASREHSERIELLQQQLEQQTFQLQLMQEQLKSQQQTVQPWQIPNYAHFPEYQQQLGYQELPPPGTASGATATPAQAPSTMPMPIQMGPNPTMFGQPMPQGQINMNYPQPYTQPQFVPQMGYGPNSPVAIPQIQPMMAPGQVSFSQEQAIPLGGNPNAYGMNPAVGAMQATYTMPPSSYTSPGMQAGGFNSPAAGFSYNPMPQSAQAFMPQMGSTPQIGNPQFQPQFQQPQYSQSQYQQPQYQQPQYQQMPQSGAPVQLNGAGYRPSTSRYNR